MTRAVGDPARPRGLAWLVAAEAVAGALGFAATVHLARHLGVASFAGVEYAAAVSAWLLVLVRGGIEVVVLRESARRPRLVGRLTDLLLGMKLTCALAGYALVLAVAALAGPDRGPLVALAGLTLFASALSADVGPRALGRLGTVAIIQMCRVVGYAGLILMLVSRPEHASRAVAAMIGAELVAALLFGLLHAKVHGWARPRFRRRPWQVLARRGLVAGVSRFARVGLYGADILCLGAIGSLELGPYAASRRVVFAVLAIGLVVPSALGPMLARSWATGGATARDAMGRAACWLVRLGLPASVGLALVADRALPVVFGPAYRDAAPWLVLLSLRLVPMLLGSLHHSALVAIRAESAGLALMLGTAALALLLVPASAWWAGARGAGLAMLAVESIGAAAAWRVLDRRGAAPPWHHFAGGPVLACLLMALVCGAARTWPLVLVCAVGAASYAVVLAAGLAGQRSGIRTGEVRA